MAEKVQFELVSPARILVSEPVDMVVVPGTEGDFGVLPGHAPLISTVRPGVIAVYQAGIVTERLFVAGGFAEVANDRVTVLAEDALPVASISRAAAEAERAEWEAKLPALRSSASEADKPLLLAAERALAAAVAKIDAAGAATSH